MSIETFFKNFELLTDAPNAVAKLRELILQLAARGKLVHQDQSDESASILISQIITQRNTLISQGELKDEKPLPSVVGEEVLHPIPSNWIWTRLGEVVNYSGAKKLSPDELSENVWLLDLEDIEKDTSRIIARKTFGEKNSKSTKAKFKPGDVLYGKLRPYLNKVLVADADGYSTTEIVPLQPYKGVIPEYVMYILKRPDFLSYVNSKTYGINLPRLGTEDGRKAVFPLPPIKEQKRIVEKCDRLLSFCNQIEVRQQQRQESIVRMNESAIAQLLSSHNPDEFRQHWQRICNNFDLLYSIPETIPKLRQAILQLAVQGKLVRQDPNDEPACVLLARIASTKKQLIEEGRIKDALIPMLEGDNIPYEVPNTWSWVRFSVVILDIEAGVSPLCEKRPKDDEEWGVIKISAVSWDNFDSNENKALPVEVEPRKEFEIRVGDFLISRANTSQLVGKSVVVEDTPPRLLLNDKTLRVSFTDFSDKKFFNLYNNSLAARIYYAEQGTGTSYSMRNITREQIRNIPVPVPPLAEQKRIVAKVDRLMSLCDNLEAKLKEARSHSETLMEVAAKQVLIF